MDPWDGNNEPFITQNETARKNKYAKSTLYQRPLLPKASGAQGTECLARRAKSYSKVACPSCQPDQVALTTWWRRALVQSECEQGGLLTFFDRDGESRCDTSQVRKACAISGAPGSARQWLVPNLRLM